MPFFLYNFYPFLPFSMIYCLFYIFFYNFLFLFLTYQFSRPIVCHTSPGEARVKKKEKIRKNNKNNNRRGAYHCCPLLISTITTLEYSPRSTSPQFPLLAVHFRLLPLSVSLSSFSSSGLIFSSFLSSLLFLYFDSFQLHRFFFSSCSPLATASQPTLLQPPLSLRKLFPVLFPASRVGCRSGILLRVIILIIIKTEY